MTQKRQRANLAIALLLVFSLSQVYVNANLATNSPAAKTEAATLARSTGKLITLGNNPISLNGNRTHSGTTVLSGSQLQTPAGVEASVQLGQGGLLHLAPETSLTLNFDDASIDVTVTSGYATLTTNEGIRSSITMPDGKTTRTDVTELPTIEDPAASTMNGGDNTLFAAAVMPGQSAEAKRAMRVCMRAAELEFRQQVREAQNRMRDAKAEAEANYRSALRAATNDAQRRAAQEAKRDALRKAQLDFQQARRAAQTARQEAVRACENPSTPPPTASEQPPLKGSPSRAFGLSVLAAAVTTAVLIVALDDDDDRGSTVSPVKP